MKVSWRFLRVAASLRSAARTKGGKVRPNPLELELELELELALALAFP